MDGYDPIPDNPSRMIDSAELMSILANIPGIVGATCETGPVTGTAWLDIWLPGNQTIRIKATKSGGLLFTTNDKGE